MVGHIIDGNQLLILMSNDAGDVFLKLFVMFGFDQTLPSLYSENNVKIDLGVGIRH